MVKKYLLIICLLLIYTFSLFSEEHQRIGVDKKTSHLIKLDGAVSFTADKSNDADVYIILPEVSLSYIYSDTWYSIVSMSFKSVTNMQEDYNPFVVVALGDPSISAGYLTRLGDYKLRFEFSYSYPLGIWNPYEVMEKKIQSSSGYQMTMLTFSLSRILDPIILNTTLRYGVGLPRENRFGWSMIPGDMSLSFTITEVLNDEIGLLIGVNNNLYLPVIRTGNIDYGETSYNISLSISLLWHKDRFDASTTVNKNLSAVTSSPDIRMDGGWEIVSNDRN